MDRNYADADAGSQGEGRPDQQTEGPRPGDAGTFDWMKFCQEIWTHDCVSSGCVSEEDWKRMEQMINDCLKAMKG